MCEDPNACKQRFKGVENFLRRVAFNLGNTPSQTEVKIISCIPIDVTDLQNKIINLERQLHDTKSSKAPPKVTPVHTALFGPNLKNPNTALSSKYGDIQPLETENTDPLESQCGDGSTKQRKSTVSFTYPSWSHPNSEHPPFGSNKNCGQKNNEQDIGEERSNEDHSKNFFKRARKKLPLKKKEKNKTHLVYYAQAQSTPFNSYDLSTAQTYDNFNFPRTHINEVLSKSYLANVIQRHYDPERVVEEFSDTSNFTSPVCRDIDHSGRCPYESDLCSCCHGQFQNVDKYIGKNQNFIIEPMMTNYNEYNGNTFYDSNLYDIVPVKEKTTKLKDDQPKKDHKRHVEMRCWPENARYKPHTVKVSANVNTRKKATGPSRDTKEYIKKKSPKIIKQKKVDQKVGQTDTSNSCSIDCGETYAKPVFAHKTETAQPVRRIYRQNPEPLTIDVDAKKLRITKSIQIDINSIENKTEETLNQIKSILQSVLQEVKTNPQINEVPNDKLKKDAVIQKGTSQSNIQACSTLLRSFTYNNSYNTTSYLPTYSRQIPSHFCYPSVPCQRLKCTQNFPLLIQAPAHQMCSCYYKNSGHNSKPFQRQAATTATNTESEIQESQEKETDKLIKEIYKSIALTLQFPKDTSISEFDDLKSLTNNSTNRSEDKELGSTIVPTPVIHQKDIQVEASMTPLSTTTVRSKLIDNSISITSITKVRDMTTYREYDDQTTEPEAEDIEDSRKRMHGFPKHETRAYIASPTMHRVVEESSTDEEEVEDITDEYIEAKTEKKGLFKRMLGSVKLFNKGNKNKTNHATSKRNAENEAYQDGSESDSDDYTIYSEKSNLPRPSLKTYNDTPNMYAHTTYEPRDRTREYKGHRNLPCMEQEYRRQWNENLIFQENRGRRYSSERPYSTAKDQTPVYWQNYEARSAVIGHPVSIYQAIMDPNLKTVRNEIGQADKSNLDGKGANKISKMGWLKKRKLGIGNCGQQWKKFIIES